MPPRLTPRLTPRSTPRQTQQSAAAPAKPASARAAPAGAPAPASYWELSRRPLHVLLFLLPLIVAYEIGMPLLPQPQGASGYLDIKAHGWLVRFFEMVGIAQTGGLYLGGLAIVIVLVCWHLINRDPLRVRPSTLAGMALESAVLTLPLLVMGALLARLMFAPAGGAGPEAAALSPGAPLAAGDVWRGMNIGSKITISIGAGLYEELVFRMLLIAAVHTVLVDLGKASHFVGGLVAVIVSAALFTWYHPLDSGGEHSRLHAMLSYFLLGLYFGVVFISRGFGIVVAVHALYDIATIVLQGPRGD